MIRIELVAANIDELAADIAALNASLNPSNVNTAPKPEEEPFDAKSDVIVLQEEQVVDDTATAEAKSPPRRTRTPRTATAVEQAAVEAKATTEAKASPRREPEVTEAVLRNLVLKLMQLKGRETVEAILGQFGIKRATEVEAARASELVAAFEDAIHA